MHVPEIYLFPTQVPHSSQKSGLDPDFLYAPPAMTACAAFSEESRIKSIDANKLHRKSGKWASQP
jgi:hypothetical protein